jgi:methylmalonyl-CoA/ethylmalonyl-CoA epimerase
MLTKIGQIAIRVHDLARATAFYRDVLGLTFLFAAPNLAFFEIGGVWLMLSPAEQPEFDHPASLLYFDVADIGAVYATMKGKGVSFRSEPHAVHRDGAKELWLADFYDSEQNTYVLRQWKAAA